MRKALFFALALALSASAAQAQGRDWNDDDDDNSWRERREYRSEHDDEEGVDQLTPGRRHFPTEDVAVREVSREEIQ